MKWKLNVLPLLAAVAFIFLSDSYIYLYIYLANMGNQIKNNNNFNKLYRTKQTI